MDPLYFEDVHEGQWVTQRLRYGGPTPHTPLDFFGCCFAAFHSWSCIVWHEHPAYECGILASYYKFSASPKLSKHHIHALKRQIASRKWHPNYGSFLLVLRVKQPSLVSSQTRGLTQRGSVPF